MVLIEISTGTIVIAGIIVFLFVILALVGMLLYARKKLIPQGNVSITINDDQKLEVSPGSSLLSTLSTNGIFLP